MGFFQAYIREIFGKRAHEHELILAKHVKAFPHELPHAEHLHMLLVYLGLVLRASAS